MVGKLALFACPTLIANLLIIIYSQFETKTRVVIEARAFIKLYLKII